MFYLVFKFGMIEWIQLCFSPLRRGPAYGGHCGARLFQDQNLHLCGSLFVLLPSYAVAQAGSGEWVPCPAPSWEGCPGKVSPVTWKLRLPDSGSPYEQTNLANRATFYCPGWPLLLIKVLLGFMPDNNQQLWLNEMS